MAYYPIADHSLGHSGWIMYTRSLSTKTLLFSFIITIGLLLLPIAAAAQSSSSSAPSATTGPSVTVLIHAADRQGAAVAISDKSLTVHAENEQVQVLELKPANIAPMRFVLLLDLSGSDRDEFELEKKAAAQLFGALSKGNNEGYVGVFSEEVVISTRPLRLQELNEFLDGVQAHGGTALYDAVIKACDQLSRGPGAPSSRRVMLVITDGEDNASRVRQADAVKIAQRDGVPVFALQLLHKLHPDSRGEKTLTKLARETGGAVVAAASSNDIKKLLQPLDEQYFLTFVSPLPPPGATRRLEVKSMDRSIEVFAPSAYGDQSSTH